ncbi:MAG: UbiA family prenyltransferase [Halodesulfurarchaeum sp.]
MAIARSGQGRAVALVALGSQIHPVFMLPPVAVSAFGAVVAGHVSLPVALLHATAIGSAVYVAHVKDGYVDYYARGEDDDHPLTVRGCRLGLLLGSVLFGATTLGVSLIGTPLGAVLTLPTWFLGYFHAPALDTTPLGATLDYPSGVALAALGGFASQTGYLDREILGFAGVLFVLLAGVKIIDDAQDVEWDRENGKVTVPVALGRRRSRYLSYALMAVTSLGVLGLASLDVVPDGSAIGVFVFAAVFALAADAPFERATMLLVRGAYLLLAFFIVAVWYHPLASNPDPGVWLGGQYLYLASEIVFLVVSIVLIRKTGRLRSALKTVALLYPIAYVWDWYTLQVGIFAITRRTGIDVLGIPLEEHLFIVVVPLFVVSLHETRRKWTGM